MKKYFALLTFVTILFASTSIPSEPNQVEQIAAIIDDFALPISRRQTNDIAHALVQVRKNAKCEISWDVLLAVAMQESKLNHKAVRVNRRNGKVLSRDHGLMQFNDYTIRHRRLDKSRLNRDVLYSINAACELLTENKRKFSRRHKHWVGIYNAGTNFKNPDVKSRTIKYTKQISKLTVTIRQKYKKIYLSSNN